MCAAQTGAALVGITGCTSELHSQGEACLVDIHVLVQVEGHLPSTCTSAGSKFVVCYLYLSIASSVSSSHAQAQSREHSQQKQVPWLVWGAMPAT